MGRWPAIAAAMEYRVVRIALDGMDAVRRIKDYVREHAKERKVAPLEWTE